MTKPIYSVFIAFCDALLERPVERVQQQFNEILMGVVEDILKYVKGILKYF